VVGVVAFLVFHLFAITVYAGPINPVDITTAPVVDRYIGNSLVQTWTLFAPNPLNDERGLLIRAVVRDPVSGELVTTEWTDISTDVIARSQRSRFFAPRESRHLMNLTGMANWREPFADRLRDRTEEIAEYATAQGDADGAAALGPVTPDVPFLSPMEEEFHKDAHAMYGQYASIKAVELWGDQVNAIEVRFVVHRFPPFSQRHSNEIGHITPIDLGWFDVNEFVDKS